MFAKFHQSQNRKNLSSRIIMCVKYNVLKVDHGIVFLFILQNFCSCEFWPYHQVLLWYHYIFVSSGHFHLFSFMIFLHEFYYNFLCLDIIKCFYRLWCEITLFGLLISCWVCSSVGMKIPKIGSFWMFWFFFYCKENDVFGLSSSAAEAYGFMLVCAFVFR